jgi:hypothetical protein
MLRCSLSLLVLAGSLVGALNAAHAAELGEVRVSSHIGQPLVADIELAMVDDPAAPVAVRLASPEVYSGAGIAMPPELASVNLSVMKRDGRQFLHVTSLRPVAGEHLHLYLELVDKGQRTVRLATLWLTADPNPAPVPVPVPAPVPAARVEPAPEPPPKPAAVRNFAVVRKPEPAPVPAQEEGAKHPQPAPAKPRPAGKPLAAIVHPEPKAVLLALPIHAAQSAAPAACTQQAEQAKVCAALDGKSAALKAQIGALEGKVKSLQARLGAAPAAAAPAAAAAAVHVAPARRPAPAATAPAPAAMAPAASASAAASAAHAAEAAPKTAVAQEPPGPKPISAIKPLVPRKPKAPPPEPDTSLPWGWIGGGTALLLALGGALLLLRRRTRTVANVDIPAGPRLAERLRDSFASTRNAAPAAAKAPAEEAVEPSFD